MIPFSLLLSSPTPSRFSPSLPPSFLLSFPPPFSYAYKFQAHFIPLCHEHLPGFAITHIGFSLSYARHFLRVPGVSFNLLQKILVGPAGTAFLRDARAASRPVYVWTVNETEMMRWSIRKEVSGVITDDPRKYLDVCRRYAAGGGGGGDAPPERLSWRTCAALLWVNVLCCFFSFLLRCRYGFGVSARMGRSVGGGGGGIISSSSSSSSIGDGGGGGGGGISGSSGRMKWLLRKRIKNAE
jgi:hypothetical protein